MQLNASRIKVLQAQDDLISSMKEAAAKEILRVSHHHNHHSYKKLLHDLIVQVLLTNNKSMRFYSLLLDFPKQIIKTGTRLFYKRQAIHQMIINIFSRYGVVHIFSAPSYARLYEYFVSMVSPEFVKK